MKLTALALLAMVATLSACATDPTWERMIPPSRVAYAANGCPMHTIDDAAPLSRWKKVGVFWDQDVCEGTPYQIGLLKDQKEQSREAVRQQAKQGDQASIKIVQCWDQKNYLTWTAPAADSLIQHQWDAIPYACIQKDDPRLTETKAVSGSPQVAGK
jgi:hypothetical protein